MEYLIRQAYPGDIEEIINLCGEHAEYENAEYSPEGKAEMLSSFLFTETPALYCLIVESKNKTIGYATYMFEFSTWDAGYYLHMDCLYLRENARGFGIGEALVKEIAKRGNLKDCKLMQWQTPLANHRAIKFYNRIGALTKEKIRCFLTIG